MTTLEITPRISDKTARFRGTVAAGEHVAVTIKGGAEWLGDDAGANLTLRVLDLVTGRTLAVFPRPDETYGEDEEYVPDEWSTSAEDPNDLFCNLSLNTDRMVNAARHMLRVPVLFVLGDTDAPRTLYFRDRYEVDYWPERIGDTVPYDLDKWPKQIDEWTDLVATWTSRMNNLALDAERVDGGVKITLNDGTLETPKEVVVNDGEVLRNEMNAAIAAMGATKQNKLTFDAIPTEGSDNPVKSGGVHGAVKEVADAVTEHTGNADIHVTAAQNTAWTAKYNKPQDGIPKSDLSAGVQASLAKADTAIQSHQSLDAYVNAAGYDSTAKEIQLKHNSTVVARIDATAFIKDGMISEVKIVGDNLVIVFNADAGKESISIPLTQIFNPSNYYDKTAADGRFVQKETGKGLVAVDAALSTTSENPVQNKVVTKALYTGFTEWVCDSISEGYEFIKCEWKTAGWTGWIVKIAKTPQPPASPEFIEIFASGDHDAIQLVSSGPEAFSLSRHLITPTKTSQLTNDSGFITQHQQLTPVYSQTPTFSEWTFSRDNVALSEPEMYDGLWGYRFSGDELNSYSDQKFSSEAEALVATELTTTTSYGVSITATRTRTDIIGYTLGTQTDKPLQPQGNYATEAGMASALVQKADASDLPYRLVEPGEWEFSGDTIYDWTIKFESGEWWNLFANPNESPAASAQGRGDELVVYFPGVGVTATRPSLPGHLLDRACNRVVVSGDTTLTLPAAVPGYARDFLVRLEISGSTVPTITFAAPTGETITYETDGDEFPVPDEAGNWLYSFTESCVAHKFAVSLKKVNTVAQGGS